jgi:hypothetical protein
MKRFRRFGRLIFEAGPVNPRHGRIGCGDPKAGWAARHVWWRFYWVNRRRARNRVTV